MSRVKYSGNKDGYIYRCKKHKSQKSSLRKGTILEGQNLTLVQFVRLCYAWSADMGNQQAMSFTGLKNKAVGRWYSAFRSSCKQWLEENPIKLGGVDTIVEVDESCVKGKK